MAFDVGGNLHGGDPLAREVSWPRWTAWLGLVMCLALAVLLPLRAVLITAGVLAVGFALTTLLGRRSGSPG
ncbi:MAG: hypothetical protein H0W01_16865 [Pseudonocardiales bacterium]|nr:hypothetical protein [Pseudonocardiales bacterium]